MRDQMEIDMRAAEFNEFEFHWIRETLKINKFD